MSRPNGLNMRPVELSDLDLMLAWRNNPNINKGFYQQGLSGEVIPWDRHVKWFMSRGSEWSIYICQITDDYLSRRVGVLTISQLSSWSPEIGYYVGETASWGKGIGTYMVEWALEHLQMIGKEYAHTTVLNHNTGSIKLLERCGFVKMCTSRELESMYQVKIDPWLLKKIRNKLNE